LILPSARAASYPPPPRVNAVWDLSMSGVAEVFLAEVERCAHRREDESPRLRHGHPFDRLAVEVVCGELHERKRPRVPEAHDGLFHFGLGDTDAAVHDAERPTDTRRSALPCRRVAGWLPREARFGSHASRRKRGRDLRAVCPPPISARQSLPGSVSRPGRRLERHRHIVGTDRAGPPTPHLDAGCAP